MYASIYVLIGFLFSHLYYTELCSYKKPFVRIEFISTIKVVGLLKPVSFQKMKNLEMGCDGFDNSLHC